jgi:hypothetical protein
MEKELLFSFLWQIFAVANLGRQQPVQFCPLGPLFLVQQLIGSVFVGPAGSQPSKSALSFSSFSTLSPHIILSPSPSLFSSSASSSSPSFPHKAEQQVQLSNSRSNCCCFLLARGMGEGKRQQTPLWPWKRQSVSRILSANR